MKFQTFNCSCMQVYACICVSNQVPIRIYLCMYARDMVALWISLGNIHRLSFAAEPSIRSEPIGLGTWSCMASPGWCSHFLLLQSPVSCFGTTGESRESPAPLPGHGQRYPRYMIDSIPMGPNPFST